MNVDEIMVSFEEFEEKRKRSFSSYVEFIPAANITNAWFQLEEAFLRLKRRQEWLHEKLVKEENDDEYRKHPQPY